MIQVRGPDGSIVNFPDGTSPQIMQTAMARHYGPPTGYAAARAQANTAHPQGVLQQTLASMGNSGAYGFLGKLDGAAQFARTAVQNAAAGMGLGKANPYTPQNAFDATVDADRAQMGQFAQQHPALNAGAQLAGAVMAPGAMKGAKFIGAAKGLGGTIARSALVGGVAGGAYGAGGAQGNLGQQVQDTIRGAENGAAVGAAVPVAGGAMNRAYQGVKGVVGNVAHAAGLVSPEQTAMSRVATAMQKDLKVSGQTPADLQAAQQNWPGVSQPTLMDIGGENTRGLMRGAAMQGPARNVAVDYRDSVAGNLQDHQTALANALTPGESRSGMQLTNDLTAARSAADQQNYPAFQNSQIPVGTELNSALSGNTGANAISYGRQIADSRRLGDALSEFDALSNGTAQNVSAGTLDLARQGLRDSAISAKLAGNGSLSGGLTGRAQDLASILMDVPGFSKAVNTHADLSSQIDAIAHGGTGVNSSGPLFAAGLDGMNSDAMNASGVGFRDALVNALLKPTEGALGTGNRLASSGQVTNNLTAQFGPDATQAFQDGLSAENDRMTNANFVSPNTGSQSTPRVMDHGLKGMFSMLKNGAAPTDADQLATLNMGLSSDPISDPLLAALVKQSNAPQLAPYTVAPLSMIASGASANGSPNPVLQ